MVDIQKGDPHKETGVSSTKARKKAENLSKVKKETYISEPRIGHAEENPAHRAEGREIGEKSKKTQPSRDNSRKGQQYKAEYQKHVHEIQRERKKKRPSTEDRKVEYPPTLETGKKKSLKEKDLSQRTYGTHHHSTSMIPPREDDDSGK